MNVTLFTHASPYLFPHPTLIICPHHLPWLMHVYIYIPTISILIPHVCLNHIEQIGKNYSEVVAVVIFHYGFYLLTTQSWGTLRHVLGPTFDGGVSRSLDYVYTLFSLKKKSIDYLIFYLIRFNLQSLVLFKLFSPKLIRHNK